MLKLIRIFAFSSIIALAACKVGNDYKKPQFANMPEAFKEAAKQDKKSEIEQNWWKNFNDPILDKLVDIALKDNIDIKIAASRISQARAVAKVAKYDLLPTVNIKGDAVRQGNRLVFGKAPFDLTKPFDSFQAGFDASWELDLFGGKRRELESRKAALESAKAESENAKIVIIAEIAKNYSEIRLYQNQITSQKDIIKAAENNLKIMQERFKVGNNNQSEVIEAQNSLSQSQSRLNSYQELLTNSQYSLDILLGGKIADATNIIGDVKPIPLASGDFILAAPANIIAGRPDIKSAERKLAEAVAKHNVAIAGLFPDISLSGFFGLIASDESKLLQAGSKSYQFGGGLLFPILNYSKISANIDFAKAESEEAALNYRKSILTALSDIEKSLSSYKKSDQNRILADDTVKQNWHALEIADMRYKQGISSFVEVLQARKTLLDSQIDLADKNAKTTQNLIAVYKNLGGGWNLKQADKK